MSLSRAVDSAGTTLEVLLSPPRDAQAAKRVLEKTLAASHPVPPHVITVEKNAASPQAFKEWKEEGALPNRGELRQVKSLNTMVEQDPWFIKRGVKAGLGFFSLETAWNPFQG